MKKYFCLGEGRGRGSGSGDSCGAAWKNMLLSKFKKNQALVWKHAEKEDMLKIALLQLIGVSALFEWSPKYSFIRCMN